MKDAQRHEDARQPEAAFAGESQANRRYLSSRNKADVEGQNDVAALFRSTRRRRDRSRATATSTTSHRSATGDRPADRQLAPEPEGAAVARRRRHEYTDMYPSAWRRAPATKASTEIADWFETLAKAERSHANVSRRLWTRWPTSRQRSRWRASFRAVRRSETEGPPEVSGLTTLDRKSAAGPPRGFRLPWHDHPRRQPRGSHPPPARLAQSPILRRGIALQGNGAGLRHLPRSAAAAYCARSFPRSSDVWSTRARPGRWDGSREEGLLEGGRPVLPVRRLLHDEVPVRAAAPVEPRSFRT